MPCALALWTLPPRSPQCAPWSRCLQVRPCHTWATASLLLMAGRSSSEWIAQVLSTDSSWVDAGAVPTSWLLGWGCCDHVGLHFSETLFSVLGVPGSRCAWCGFLFYVSVPGAQVLLSCACVTGLVSLAQPRRAGMGSSRVLAQHRGTLLSSQASRPASLVMPRPEVHPRNLSRIRIH